MGKKIDANKLMGSFRGIKKKPASTIGQAIDVKETPSKYENTIKGRWIERNLKNLSKGFQEAWKLTHEKKDKLGKQKLLTAVVKEGKKGYALTNEVDVLDEMVSEIKSKGMSSSVKAYGKTLMVQKCGGMEQFKEALESGEVIQVPGPCRLKSCILCLQGVWDQWEGAGWWEDGSQIKDIGVEQIRHGRDWAEA